MTIEGGAVRGVAAPGAFAFRGLPYAAPPIGLLRWRAPQQPAGWRGVRDATRFAPSCPQAPSPFLPPGPLDEDCLYLNVSTPTLRHDRNRPVLVWIHGGGLTQDASRNYDGARLAADGTVVVTVNYRLGALGFLAHPALATRPGGPTGNYGLVDQRAALRWMQHNIRRFGGDPHNVTIAGESAGGLSVLAHLVSRGSRGLFQRAVVQSGALACPALRVDRWTAARVPTYAYEFNDDAAPQLFAPPGVVAPVATYASELQYLFDLPNAPFPAPLKADQQALAAAMRAAWAHFAASGDPATRGVPWPAFRTAHRERVLSLVTPRPRVATGFAARHHCAFWAAG